MQSGTGTGAQFGHPAAGKTGTTDKHADAWFSGYTPRLQTTVWVGYPRARSRWRTCTASRSPAAPSRLRSGISSWATRSAISTRCDLTEPTNWPVWSDFEQGQYARSFGYYEDEDYVPPAEDEDEEEETTETEPAPPSTAEETPAPADDAAASGRDRIRRRWTRRPERSAPLRRGQLPTGGRGSRFSCSSVSASRLAWLGGARRSCRVGRPGGQPRRVVARLSRSRLPAPSPPISWRFGSSLARASRLADDRRRWRRRSSCAARRAAPPLDRCLDVLGVRLDRERRRQSLPRHAGRASRSNPAYELRGRRLARHDVRLRAGVQLALAARRVLAGPSADTAAWVVQGARGARDAGVARRSPPASRPTARSRPRSWAGTRCSRSTSPAAATTTRG